MSNSETPLARPLAGTRIVYRPYAFDPPANPMGNKLDAELGNPTFDGRVLQIDETYLRFVENYDAARAAGQIGRHVGEDHLPSETRSAACSFIRETMVREYPEYFRYETGASGAELHNALLGETTRFGADGEYAGGGRCDYNDTLDALAAQLPEDFAIVQIEDGRDRLAAVHVVAPSGWAPCEKLGGSFLEVHHPVEHHREWFAKVQTGVRNLAKTERPVQRFGWSLTNDNHLNHHPALAPSGEARVRGDRDLYVRVERQVLKGFPELSALLFTIHVHIERCSDLPPPDRAKLRDAVVAMNPSERAYKGVHGDFVRIVEQLSA